MRTRRLAGVILAAVGAVVSLTPTPALATSHDGGATHEEFVCFRSTGDRIRIGTGRVVTTPSGKTHVVCTGEPL